VDYISLVAVVDRGEHLLDDVGGVALAERVLFRDAFEQFASVAKSITKTKMVTSVAAQFELQITYSVTKK